MNMELFRYWKVAQLEQNAITRGKFSNEKSTTSSIKRFFDVNKAINTFVLMRFYSCLVEECRQC
ncbi:hypothetical protein SAMN04490206_6220 [Pseudomonas umsongensis]|nr:hypothetical protein SAMN04490206_6220 [Pseudomonas umsongensis]